METATHAALQPQAIEVPATCGTKDRRHPVTSNVEYNKEELEFMDAVQQWKQRTRRSFPTVCDYLAIAKALGYEKRPS